VPLAKSGSPRPLSRGSPSGPVGPHPRDRALPPGRLRSRPRSTARFSPVLPRPQPGPRHFGGTPSFPPVDRPVLVALVPWPKETCGSGPHRSPPPPKRACSRTLESAQHPLRPSESRRPSGSCRPLSRRLRVLGSLGGRIQRELPGSSACESPASGVVKRAVTPIEVADPRPVLGSGLGGLLLHCGRLHCGRLHCARLHCAQSCRSSFRRAPRFTPPTRRRCCTDCP
jgi:hypothetical protein